MRRLALILWLLFLTNSIMSAEHRVPTNRSELKGGDWFPYVISKIAPLESWTVEPSAADTIRGLNKLIRMARMAEKSKLGIYFGG